MRRILPIIISILLMAASLQAKPELWVGASFLADRNNVSSQIEDRFPAMGEKVDQIKSIGLDMDLVFFPFPQVRIGLIGGYNMMLPIGITAPGGSNEGYITYDFDYRQDLSIGLAYYQFFSDTLGAFLTGSFQYSFYRTAKEHIANDTAPMEYIKTSDYGVIGELGVISRADYMYFRLGFSFFYDLLHKDDPGMRIGLVAGGGFLI